MDTYFTEVQAGVTLSVNAFEFWHAASGPSRPARLVKDLTCAPASQAYVERIFESPSLEDMGAGSVSTARAKGCKSQWFLR